MFHPLIAPLTTYMYTTDIQDNGTVSATDDERLPPGGFSLRHGFPGWFGRRGRSTATSFRQVSGGQQQPQPPATPAKGGSSSALTTPDSKATTVPMTASGNSISTYEVLQYIRSTFDDETVLDSVPLEAAGNPGAWHAWRTRQRQLGKLPDSTVPAAGAPQEGGEKPEAEAQTGEPEPANEETDSTTVAAPEPVAAAEATPAPAPAPVPTPTQSMSSRDPGQWNWAGVWEDRVKKGIAASLSEPVLYGGAAAGDDLIHFLPMEENDVGVVKDNLLRTLGSTA
ncbi:hypothetical protein ACHAQA_005626 [Verticillium albo-atrum]